MSDTLPRDEDDFPFVSAETFFSKQHFDKITNSVNMFSQLINLSIFLNRNITLIADIDW